MRGIATLTLIVAPVLIAVAGTPAAAESWSRFSSSDRTAYLVDVDSLTPVEGVATTRFARVPTHGEPSDQSHQIEEVLFRCADSQSKSVVEISYGADGAETERFAEDAEWEDAPASGLYGAMKSFACEDMRPQGQAWPTIAAFIADGRKSD